MSTQRPRRAFSWDQISVVLAGGSLGAALAGVLIIALLWVTLDPCVKEAPVPSTAVATLLALGVAMTASLVRAFEMRAMPVWIATGVVTLAVGGLWIALLSHTVDAALDCTWLLHPAVPEQ